MSVRDYRGKDILRMLHPRFLFSGLEDKRLIASPEAVFNMLFTVNSSYKTYYRFVYIPYNFCYIDLRN